MTLPPGTKLGPYEILSPLGAGGMGEVYRARDTKLGRDVAVKVLPAAVADDADRLARFEREAQVLASLNHPNIAAIYGLEDSGSVRALVMELVEGPTLADHLGVGAGLVPAPTASGQIAHARAGRPQEPALSVAKGAPLQVDECLHIARQIAEALEAAHEKNIIHRDLKPANVKITPEGVVKVLDFGLAKAADSGALSGDPSASPTLTAQATQGGFIIGTAAYMAPEQARGQAVDRRADIWSFGAVLFEMLSGQRAFVGETISDVLASVLKFEPDWSALPATTPPAMVRLLRRCLTKDRKQRLQAIGEARIAIDITLEGTGAPPLSPLLGEEGKGEARGGEGAPLPMWRRAGPWLVLTGLALVAGIAAGWWVSVRRTPPSPNWTARILGGPRDALCPRISPDGHTLAFQAMVDGLTQVAVMDTESGDWTILTKDRSRGYVTELNWSPDGSQIYFDRYLSVPHGIYTISRFGGDEHLVLEDAMGPEVLPDGGLLLIRVNQDRYNQLYRYWPDGGRLEALDALTFGWGGINPLRAFHDGKGAVFYGETSEQVKTSPTPHLYAIDLTSGKARRLAPEVDIRPPTSMNLFPIAVTSDDQSVLTEIAAGDLHRVISIPRYGTGPVRTLFSLTVASDFMDVDKEDNVYLDQAGRPLDVLRFPASGGTPEVLIGPWDASTSDYMLFQLPDGRAVFDAVVAGRSRLLVAKPGGEATPFIQTKEESSLPACLVGESELAFLLGPPGKAVVAVASLADGRIVRRLDAIPGNEVTDLAASPDRKTLYYVVSGTVWAIAASGGQPRQICAGDAVAPDPNGKDLIVQLTEKAGIRLLRVPVSGGAGVPILVRSALRLAPSQISPNAVGKDGRVVVSITPPDSWFFEVGILDPRSGKLQRIPVNLTGDFIAPGWLPDGRILSSAWPLRGTLWRFHAVRKERQRLLRRKPDSGRKTHQKQRDSRWISETKPVAGGRGSWQGAVDSDILSLWPSCLYSSRTSYHGIPFLPLPLILPSLSRAAERSSPRAGRERKAAEAIRESWLVAHLTRSRCQKEFMWQAKR